MRLEPCPFCGGKNASLMEAWGFLYVGCGDCGTEGPGFDWAGFGSSKVTAEEDATMAWNKRASIRRGGLSR